MGTEQIIQITIPDHGPMLAGAFASVFLGILLYTAIHAGVYVKRLRKLRLAKDLISEGHEKIMQDEAYRGTEDTSEMFDFYTEEDGKEIKFTGKNKRKEIIEKSSKSVRLKLNKKAKRVANTDLKENENKKLLEEAGLYVFDEENM